MGSCLLPAAGACIATARALIRTARALMGGQYMKPIELIEAPVSPGREVFGKLSMGEDEETGTVLLAYWTRDGVCHVVDILRRDQPMTRADWKQSGAGFSIAGKVMLDA